MRVLSPLSLCCLSYWIARPALGGRPQRFSDGTVSLGRVPGCCAARGEPPPEGEEDTAHLLAQLESERSADPSLDQAWRQAGLVLRSRRRPEGPSPAPGLRGELAQAVTAYALEFPPPPDGPLYLRFNRDTRNCLGAHPGPAAPPACSRFRAYGSLLERALRELLLSGTGGDGEGEGAERPGMVYRGATKAFWARVGRTVEFGSFTSASASREVAEAFAGGAGGGGTLFHIRTARGVPLGELSPYPGEREVLIPPCEAFRVVKATRSRVGEAGRRRVDLYLTSIELGRGGGGASVGQGGVPLALLGMVVTLAWGS